MKRKYDITAILQSYIGYKGLPFPGAFFGMLGSKTATASGYEHPEAAPGFKEFTDKGTRLYKKDHLGRWYFMPVTFIVEGKEIEFPTAVMNITGKKTIVETAMVGRKGTVKELISVDDYRVSITGFIQSTDGTYPENEIVQMQELYNHNASVELISALTVLVFDDKDQVVITSIDYPATPGLEDGQVVKIECITDKPFELIID